MCSLLYEINDMLRHDDRTRQEKKQNASCICHQQRAERRKKGKKYIYIIPFDVAIIFK